MHPTKEWLLKLKLWGTRGSLPRPFDHKGILEFCYDLIKIAGDKGLKSLDEFKEALGNGSLRDPLVYGGHTTCSEIIHGDHRCYVDMGTGITDAGQEAMAEGRNSFTIFQTHVHWDHIMGMPFFVPIYIPGTKITIYHVHPKAPEYIKLQFNGVNFPVRWDQLAADIEFRQIRLYDKVSFDDMTVSPFALDHPGGSFGYRFEQNGKSVAIGVDGEYKRLTPKELGRDLPYYQDLDILVFDAQYEMDELASRFDWGHCSPPIGVDLALREGIKNLILTHHDPRANEQKGTRMLEEARKHLKLQLPAYKKIWDKLGQPTGPNVFSAYDGMTVDLDKL